MGTSTDQQPTLDDIRHSLAHLLAHAVQDILPDAKFGVGPVIENGFYYDFLLPRALTTEDLPKLEQRMRKLIAQNLPFTHEEVSVSEARKRSTDQPFKLDLINDLEHEGSVISYEQVGEFRDLCRGGHVASTKRIDAQAFALESIAGAYWRGDEHNQQLQRVYGAAFTTKAELDAYLAMKAEAAKRDHRLLNATLKLYTTSDLVGPGLPLWLPNGTVIIDELERLAKETETAAGYLRVRTPHIAKEEMYRTSGHLPYYAESMFPPLTLHEGDAATTYYLKAMNCPHHHVLYASEPRSYRDLPLRLAEYGTVYRYEKSGELFGLMRVRMLSMNDAHLYVTPDQFADEFNAVNRMYLDYFKLFGFQKYVMRFSTHDPKELGKKYVDEPALWKQTEDLVRRVLQESKIPYVEVPNEAAFYGPKVDVQVWSSIGREFSIATNQVDFAQPRRFGLTYTDDHGNAQTPIVIHRAPLGTHERFIGFLVEHYGGAFPTWLAPVQVAIISVGKAHVEPAHGFAEELRRSGFRVAAKTENETVGAKIRTAVQEKIPYVVVIGDREAGSDTLAVRVRGEQKPQTMARAAFIARLTEEVRNRT